MRLNDSELKVMEAIELICLLIVTADTNDVSEKTGVTKATVNRWKRQGVRRPGLLTFIALAAYFGVSVTIKDLRVAADPKRRSIHNLLGEEA